MKAIKFTILLAATALLATEIQAIQLSPQQALARVSTLSSQKLSAEPSDPTPAFTAKSEQSGVTAFYIFNNSDAQGYTIVSASPETEPVLGYTTAGTFDYNSLPPAMKWWLEEYQKQSVNNRLYFG